MSEPNEPGDSPSSSMSAPQPTSSERGPAPDDLKWVGPEDDDSKLVTEGLSRMGVWTRRLLALWLLGLAAAAFTCLYLGWPKPVDRDWRLATDSLAVRLKRIQIINNTLPSDSAKALIARELQGEGAPVGTGGRAAPAQSREISDRLLFRISLLCGILGACAHGMASLIQFRGERRLFRSWVMWYFILPPLGGLVAAIFLLLLRAGLLPGSVALDALSPFGVGAVSALAGMFTDKATAKLAEVLETMFHTETPPRQGPLKPVT